MSTTITVRLPDDLAEWLDASLEKSACPAAESFAINSSVPASIRNSPFCAWLDRCKAHPASPRVTG